MIKSAKWDRLKSQWAVLSFYQCFESAVALVLTFVIGLIVLVALFRLTLSVVGGLLWGALDPLDQAVFQSVFGEILRHHKALVIGNFLGGVALIGTVT